MTYKINEIMNSVVCDDCMNVLKDLPDKCIDLILTDPPYGINYQSNMRVMSEKFDKLENDNNNSRFLAYKEFYRVLKDNTVAIIFCSFKNYADDYNELEKYFNIKNCIVWFKGGGGIGDLTHSLLTDYEMAIVGHKGQCQLRGKRYGSVWKSNKVNPNTMFHPTEKPIDIIQKMIESFSDEGNLVLDSYLGGGSTAIASKNIGRNFIGIEIEPKYVQICKDRLRQGVLL
jgi:site-specific DNA-methyltransferase (adenine-specific)